MELSKNKTMIMGVLNVTPDSFSDGGQYFNNLEAAVAHAKQMVAEGADLIDIGGESSRPGSTPVSAEEESRRVLPIIQRLAKEVTVPISIDTYKPSVADACLRAGARILNDITGLTNPTMIAVAATHQVPVVIMHMQGTPKTMQLSPAYDDVIKTIKKFFAGRIKTARAAGITEIILDPGIGFGKTVAHNIQILRKLKEFTEFGFPILVGPSRKSFLGTITGLPVADRLVPTIASVAVASLHGATIVRAHDVAPCRKALELVDAIKNYDDR